MSVGRIERRNSRTASFRALADEVRSVGEHPLAGTEEVR